MRIDWHANGDGYCHAECEAKNHVDNSHSGCGLIDNLPWFSKFEAVPVGKPCPFAVLANVLGLHERRDGAQLHQRGREDPQRVFGITPEEVVEILHKHLVQKGASTDDEARAAFEKRLREQNAMDDPRR